MLFDSALFQPPYAFVAKCCISSLPVTKKKLNNELSASRICPRYRQGSFFIPLKQRRFPDCADDKHTKLLSVYSFSSKLSKKNFCTCLRHASLYSNWGFSERQGLVKKPKFMSIVNVALLIVAQDCKVVSFQGPLFLQ